MASDRWERIKFGGAVLGVAEAEFAASFNDDKGGECMDTLYDQYINDGKPKLKPWARQKLSRLFLYVDEPPEWVNRIHDWPFLNGNPMVFIWQYAIPETDVARNALTTDVVLYVFGARTPGEHGGVEMQYRVVAQYTDMPR